MDQKWCPFNHINIWQVSLKLRDTCQIWTRYSSGKWCVGNSEKWRRQQYKEIGQALSHYGMLQGIVFRIKTHDDDMRCKCFQHYWPFVRGIHWSPLASHHKGSLCCLSAQTVDQTVELLMIWDTMTFMSHHCNKLSRLLSLSPILLAIINYWGWHIDYHIMSHLPFKSHCHMS